MPSHFYIHLPYCRRKCPYCDFFKRVPQTGERERYVEAVLTEMTLAARDYPEFAGTCGHGLLWRRDAVAASAGRNCRATRATACVVGDCRGGRDHARGQSRHTVGGHCRRVARCGREPAFARGAVVFRAQTETALPRSHGAGNDGRSKSRPRGGAREFIPRSYFRPAGENLEELRADLANLLELAPQHVSLYNLEFHEGTPFDRWRASGKLVPLSADLEADLYLEIHATLAQGGLRALRGLELCPAGASRGPQPGLLDQPALSGPGGVRAFVQW